MQKLASIVERLRKGQSLPAANQDHRLTGKLKSYRECHIEPDWLLVYCIHDDLLILELTATGSHALLFGLKQSSELSLGGL